MNKDMLSAYRRKAHRIRKLKSEIMDLSTSEVQTIKGTVKASEKSFPYLPGRVSVEIEDPQEVEIKKRKIARKEKEIESLMEQLEEIEDYIDQIEDPLEKIILEMYYIDGEEKICQKEIAFEINMSRSYVSKVTNKH